MVDNDGRRRKDYAFRRHYTLTEAGLIFESPVFVSQSVDVYTSGVLVVSAFEHGCVRRSRYDQRQYQ